MKADKLALVAIRKAIILGVLKPGTLIDENEVAGHLNLSRMPIRQAMGVLENEGLVRRVYKKGVFVTGLSRDEVEEIYSMRARLEGLAIRRAIPLLTAERIEQLEEILSKLVMANDDLENFLDLNTRFHIGIYECSGWPTLIKKIIELRNSSARYVGVSHKARARSSDNARDHVEIFEACKAGDLDRAERCIEEHVFINMEALLKTMDSEASIWTA